MGRFSEIDIEIQEMLDEGFAPEVIATHLGIPLESVMEYVADPYGEESASDLDIPPYEGDEVSDEDYDNYRYMRD